MKRYSIQKITILAVVSSVMQVYGQNTQPILFHPNTKSTQVAKVESPSGDLELQLNNFLEKKGSTFYSGAVLEHENAVFNITQSDAATSGFIWLKDDNITFEISSQNGEVKLTPSDISEFLCVEYGGEELAESLAEFEPAIQVVVPVLESLPGADATIYLDFDGEKVEGTRWNGQNGIPTVFDAQPRGFTAAQMEEIYKYVASDYLPYNVNVTTNRQVFDATPIEKRVMCIFTRDAFIPGGGIAFIGSFNDKVYDDPCFVFQVILQLTATSASHEIGHTLGLNHDSEPGSIYYEGHNDWGPLMGISFNQKLDQWCKGEYTGANNFEDDLEKMTQFGINFRSDDHGDNILNATDLNITSDLISGNNEGLIEQNVDVDYFSFETKGGEIDILIDPITPKTNLRPLVKIYDEKGVEIDSHSDDHPATQAFFKRTLAAGKYYISVEGVGWGDPYSDGFTDYGSLGDYKITGSIPEPEITNASSIVVDAIKLYPNPATNILLVQSDQSIIDVQIINNLGQIILRGANQEINVSELENGTYRIKIKFENGGVSVQQFIKK